MENTAKYIIYTTATRNKHPEKEDVGHYVMISNAHLTTGKNKKLMPEYRGRYVMRKFLDHDEFQHSRIYNGISSPANMLSCVL